MTWATERLKSGKRRFHVVEMDLDYCTLTYGTAPCTAALSIGEPHKCFNTRVSCQDPTNYTPADKTYRFCSPIEGIPKLFAAIPSLQSVDIAPTRIDPGKTMGIRASINIIFADHKYHDRGVDKYVTERKTGAAAFDGAAYEPYDQGTYFGRLRARNSHYTGRAVRVYSGYLPWNYSKPPEGQPEYTEAEVLTNLREQTYVADHWEGPDSRGNFKIVAKDILRLASGDKAQCPVQNTGQLIVAIDAVVTSLTVTPTGVGALEYAASGTIRIESELMTFTRVGDVFTVVRGTDGSAAAAHVIDSAVQQCKRFTEIQVDDILIDLLTNFAGISAAYIVAADWAAEADPWLSNHIFSTVIANPTNVETLVNELCQESLVYLWWDEIVQEIKLGAIRPRTYEEKIALVTVTEDDAIIEESFSQKNGEQFTKVIVNFARPSFIDRLDDPTNFERSIVNVNSDAESANEYNESKVKRIFSRWLDSSKRVQAVQLAARTIAIFKDFRVYYRFKMTAKDSDVWTGSVINLQHRSLQGFRGENENKQVKVIEVRESEDGIFEYVAIIDSFTSRYGFIGPNTLLDYGSETQANKERYCFISDNTGKMADGSDAYRII